MDQRLRLQTLFEELLGSRNVYFQPPPSIKMSYPCIVYNREGIETDHANNRPYGHKKRYSVTVIDLDPDSPLPDKIAELPTSAHQSQFKSDQLNHDVFTLYF